MANFDISVEADESSATMALRGEADLAVAEMIFDQGANCLAKDHVTALRLDLGAVSFIDSTAISALIRLHNRAEESGQTTSLRRVPPRVARILQIAGLTDLFEVEPD